MPEDSRQVDSLLGGPRRIGLVGCVKEKADRSRRAADLYTSALFAGRRRYVESTCSEWWILSAKYGLVHPDEVVEPYDMTLKNSGHLERRRWSAVVLSAIDEHVGLTAGDIVEFHAGAEYRDFGLLDGLKARGCAIENPTEGMRIGQQLRFYKQVLRS